METNRGVPCTLNFPFLGSLEDGEPFEYLLLAIHSEYTEIAILNWFVSRSKLSVGDKVDLYIPVILNEEYRPDGSDEGTVISIENDEKMGGQVYRISLSKMCRLTGDAGFSFDEYIKKLPVTIPLVSLITYLIKDSMILKQGVRIYLRHLIPYFSRVSNYTQKEYVDLKENFLYDVIQQIALNENKLRKIYQFARDKMVNSHEISAYIDLEELREALESEISLGLFGVMFTEQKKLNKNVELQVQTNYGFAMYINAIKKLEKRLYNNYNRIVIIYLKSLTASAEK